MLCIVLCVVYPCVLHIESIYIHFSKVGRINYKFYTLKADDTHAHVEFKTEGPPTYKYSYECAVVGIEDVKVVDDDVEKRIKYNS
jgi:hypothetical protein